ncbi:MAG: tetratricopeptide repeat protein [Elusimicrobia bacterium]|nr:tetratricopeptide repeat protein [Elusimicrobiota bacterium]
MVAMPPERQAPVSPALLAALLAVVVAAVFSPALNNGFVNWDDPLYITGNLGFRGLDWGHIKWMFTTMHGGLYQPFFWLSFGLDYALWGLEPFGYHLSNLLIHAANAAVFFAVAASLLERIAPPPSPAGAPRWPLLAGAAFSALVFALHPLRVESVAWVSERRDVLSGLFYLLSILAYLRAADRVSGEESWWRRQGWALLWFAAALLSKAITISLPLVLILLDIYPLRRLPPAPGNWGDARTRPVWLEKLPFLLLAAAAGSISSFSQRMVGTPLSLQSWGLMPRACQACYGLVFYLGKTLWPAGLCAFYETPFPLLLWKWPYWACAAIVCALTAAALWAWRRWPAGLLLWSFYVVSLAPVLGLFKLGYASLAAADRWAYFACMGWALAAGAAIERLLRRDLVLVRAAALSSAAAILVALSALTARQIRVWKDSVTLWSAVLALHPDSSRAHGCLGEALIDEGRWDEAVFHLRRQQARLPGETTYSQDLAIALSRRDRRKAGTKAGTARYYNNVAAELAGQGRFPEAELAFSRSLQADPGLALTHSNMGLCLFREGRPAEAERHLRRSIRLDPRAADAFAALAAVLSAQGRVMEAAAARRQALALQSGRTPRSAPPRP